MTPRLCVIGDPVAHSLSPRIQTAMLAALGREGAYTAVTVRREELPRFAQRVRGGEFTGFNATMPHKMDLVGLVDELDESARLCQSVNTVVRRADGTLAGYSTDGAGFVEALREAGRDPRGLEVVLLGTGGAARSLAPALAKAGVKLLHVCGRRREGVEGVCGTVSAAGGAARGHTFGREALALACGGAQVLVNCTNLGMEGQGQFEDFGFLEALPRGAVVCDLIYHPAETELLRRARQRGLEGMNGLPLLVWQGVLALERFLGGAALDRRSLACAASAALSSPDGRPFLY